MNQRQSKGASSYPSPTERWRNKKPAATVLRCLHFSAQANITQDTHDTFTFGLLAEIDRGSAVIIALRLHVLNGQYVWESHSRHSMLPSLLPFDGGGDAFLLEFELQLLHKSVVRLLADDIVKLRAVIVD